MSIFKNNFNTVTASLDGLLFTFLIQNFDIDLAEKVDLSADKVTQARNVRESLLKLANKSEVVWAQIEWLG